MSSVRVDLVRKLLLPRVLVEYETIHGLLHRNFDVVVRSHSDEAGELFESVVGERVQKVRAGFLLAHSLAQVRELDAEGRTKAILCMSQEPLPVGSGLVERYVSQSASYLPSFSQVVMQILEHFRISEYADIFDGRKMRQLKEILGIYGIGMLIDVVVQVAYHGGVEADDFAATRVLLERLANPPVEKKLNRSREVAGDDPAIHARRFFRHLISHHQDPHDFAKVALSYYAVHGLGHNVSSAGRILNISRTTIHDHLSQAERAGVDKYFGFASNSSERRNFVG
jgi:hypothetical protein